MAQKALTLKEALVFVEAELPRRGGRWTGEDTVRLAGLLRRDRQRVAIPAGREREFALVYVLVMRLVHGEKCTPLVVCASDDLARDFDAPGFLGIATQGASHVLGWFDLRLEVATYAEGLRVAFIGMYDKVPVTTSSTVSAMRWNQPDLFSRINCVIKIDKGAATTNGDTGILALE